MGKPAKEMLPIPEVITSTAIVFLGIGFNTLIDQLPPRCKEIFIQSKLEKKKYKEIEFDMGISIKTVENQMSKALHFLRKNASSLML